ncbi:DNA polymerase III subunit alpha [Candidatus Blochmannia ocreatus (nom. nud.)]|uniref:DNA polymerase III subunit alpha n=1 Tax=Candidatus Blochmannia ocreatus (nom. nud.) TaxID=251538 RepID=A0ABY4SWA7_9ENTR|nr:DNA polymerase III subunit alpha [Candidatus Blochmannia ocreatus]URJ25348.1 DNA polymerase III subunit alpha [Candidatus Blochmannia ocreatus]
MKNTRFIHLHTHSDYSLIDGVSTIKKLINKVASLNMPALALTDFNNLFGCIKFYDLAHTFGIKPIIGADFLIKDNDYNNIVLNELTCLTTNKQGFYHLIALISKSYKNRRNNITPTIQRNWLTTYNAGLIILSGGCRGDIGQALLKKEKLKIEQYVNFYKKYFPNRFYLELIRTHRKHEETYLQEAIELSINKNLPVVATNDIRFVEKEDFLAHEIRVAIHNGITLNNSQHSSKYSNQQFMKSEKEMCELFSDIPESLENSVEIAYKCNVTLKLKGSFLPKFPNNDNQSTTDLLIAQAKKGLETRLICLFPNSTERHAKRKPYDLRLKHELKVINDMGLPGYFLIVMEFIIWAKNHAIPVGPGRGSGASSLVAYALRITELDPLKFDLLFERFLNPERISMPDLDIDFCMEHRDLVIEHVINTYGAESVSQIITFGTMAAKAVIRDVGRVLGHSYAFVNNIAKLIPLEFGITLKKAFSIEPQLISLYNNNEDVKNLIDIASQLEGIVRNISKHAGGLVIAPTKITDFSPLYYDKDSNHSMTQFDKNDIERIGLIKFDFLGLRTLTIINNTLKIINNNVHIHQKKTALDIYTIPLNDQKSFSMLQSAETTAVFQLESRGIKELIKRLKPDCFEDLIALIALYRPGPLQSGMVDNFINRKHGHEKIYYPDYQWEHKILRPVLESTYGIILYQEQVMQIAQVLANYTLGHADILRRAIGKKKPADMEKQRAIFRAGAIKNGINSTLAMKIFNLVEKFAGYGFNKSHSAAYALLSYQTLWLKTHYPAEFMAAVLSADMDNLNKIAHLISECKKMKLTVLPPNINTSQYQFHVNKNKEIVYGFGAIKGLGNTSIDTIITSRNQDGNFTGLSNLCERINNKKINHRIFEKLIFSGACDTFKIHRSTLVNSLHNTLKYANQHNWEIKNKQSNIFEKNIKNIDLTNIKHYTQTTSIYSNQILLKKEKEMLGLYLTHHPTVQYKKMIKPFLPNIIDISNIKYIQPNKEIYIFGLLTSIKTKLNNKKKHIIFGVIEDHSEKTEIIIFEKILDKYQHCLKENNFLLVKGITKTHKIYNNCAIIAQKLQDIDDIYKKHATSLSIILQEKNTNIQLLNNIRFFLEKNRFGTLPIYFLYQKNNIQIRLCCGTQWYITLNNQLLINLCNLIGDKHVKLEFNNC